MRRVITAGLVVVLLVDVFLVVGAKSLHRVTPADAAARYGQGPTFAGLPGWDRPLGGVRPLPGVYLYATTGSADIDRLGVRRRYPATTPRIVRHGPGCQWQEEVAIFREHVETYAACAIAGDQREVAFGTRLSYFFIPGVTDLRCGEGGSRTAAGRAVGKIFTVFCHDDEHDVDAEVGVTFVGVAQLRVGDQAVACRRLLVTTQLRGSTSGVAVRQLCVTPDTGVVVHEKRNVGVSIDSAFIGRVSYTEAAEFALTSMTPLG